MSKSKHRISKAKALKLSQQFIAKRKGSKGAFKNLPDGYIFNVEEVRQLISHPEAVYFAIQLGLKESTQQGVSKQSVTPILFVANDQYKAIPQQSLLNDSPDAGMLRAATSSEDDGDAGGFLDEGLPYPPPPVDI